MSPPLIITLSGGSVGNYEASHFFHRVIDVAYFAV